MGSMVVAHNKSAQRMAARDPCRFKRSGTPPSLAFLVIKMDKALTESHRLLCVCKSISAMIVACLTLHTGCTGGPEDAKPKDGQKVGKGQKTQAERLVAGLQSLCADYGGVAGRGG
jgi:hypothetical protein